YFCIIKITVGIAQLVRALDCGSRGRRFEPDYLPEKGKSKQIGLPFFHFCTFYIFTPQHDNLLPYP
ncbi:MAG: hypothetical protein K0S24_4431, partial [Sphingobacterium sp.]|nr:hypothetical protein [Sphingobacterium sp.]